MKRRAIQLRVPIIFDKQDCCPYEKPFGYIYKITNKINGHYYIGKHIFNKPYLDHSYKGSGESLLNAYDKYGIENFDTIILEWTDKDNNDLNRLEVYWIDVFGAYRFCQHYNLTKGGDGTFGIKRNKENNGMYGRHHSDKTRAIMSDIKKSTYCGVNHPLCKSIIQLTLEGNPVMIFSYIKEATKYGFNKSCISDCLAHRCKTHKGYKWMYLKDYLSQGGKIDVY